MMKNDRTENTQNDAPEADNPRPAELDEPLEQIPLTGEQIEELKERAARADENWQRFLRLAAEFENYKKRAARERQDAIRYANEALLQKLLPVLDNFEMAVAAAKAGDAQSVESLLTGVTMIQQQLKTLLAESGLEEINAEGQAFDPNIHEAVSEQESADVPEGHVAHQVRKGYKLKDRLLRPASVVVAKPPAQT